MQFILSFGVALVTTLLVTPLLIPLIRKYGLVDDPSKANHPAKIHTKITPRGGGLVLFIGILISGLFFLPYNRITLVLLVSAAISLLIGLLDDKIGDFSRYMRFLANIFCALLIVGSGISIPFITNPFGGIIHLDAFRFSFFLFGTHSVLLFSDLIATIWIVWVMNMLNWSKGVDGQMPGVVAISAIVIGLLTLRFPLVDPKTEIAAYLSFIIAGASIGFLFYNFHPAKIFPGYGATAVYLLLAVVSILSTAKLATAILVMGVPMVDGTFTVMRRILAKKSPFQGDKRHLHHLLLERGLSIRQIALCYWVFSAILGAVALLLNSKGKIFAIIMLFVLVGGALLFLHRSIAKDHAEKTV